MEIHQEIMAKLEEVAENPFIWKRFIKINRDKLWLTCEKLEETIENKEFDFGQFILNSIIFVENIIRKEIPKAETTLKKLDLKFRTLNEDHSLYKSKRAFSYFINIFQCYLYIEKNLREAQDCLDSIEDEESFDGPARAGILAYKGAFIMEYQNNNYAVILDLFKRSIQLDPKQPEWHFLQGKCLLRSRHLFNNWQVPTNEEILSFQKATVLGPNEATYHIFYAICIRTKAFLIMNKCSHSTDKIYQIKRLNDISYFHFQRALQLRPECPHVNIRASIFFSHLKGEYNEKKAAECLFKAYKQAPNNLLVLHTVGRHYENQKDIDQAIKYYSLSAQGLCLKAHFDLFRLRHERGKINLIESLNHILKLYAEDDGPRLEINLQLGWICYLINADLYQAAKYWEQAILIRNGTGKLKASKSKFFKGMAKQENILQILLQEIPQIIKNQTYRTEEEYKFYKHLLNYIFQQYPEVMNYEPEQQREKDFKMSRKKI